MAKLSELLIQLAKEDPDQRDSSETAERWAATMFRKGNPAARLQAAVRTFLSSIEDAQGPAAETIRGIANQLID